MRLVLWLRYRVRVEGAESLETLKGPLLVLPNHPAYVDPALVLSFLPSRERIRPLVYTDTYRHRLLRPWMTIWGALEVPELRREPRLARQQVRAMLAEVIAGWEQGERFLVYPSGRLQRDHLEQLGAARAAHDILRGVQGGSILLVRSRGVFGSMFSCAPTGDVPPLSRRMTQAVLLLIASAGVLMPRRSVHLTFALVPVSQLQGLTREQLNRWLEAWYNADGGEYPRTVPYHRWWRRRRSEAVGDDQLRRAVAAAVGAAAEGTLPGAYDAATAGGDATVAGNEPPLVLPAAGTHTTLATTERTDAELSPSDGTAVSQRASRSS